MSSSSSDTIITPNDVIRELLTLYMSHSATYSETPSPTSNTILSHLSSPAQAYLVHENLVMSDISKPTQDYKNLQDQPNQKNQKNLQGQKNLQILIPPMIPLTNPNNFNVFPSTNSLRQLPLSSLPLLRTGHVYNVYQLNYPNTFEEANGKSVFDYSFYSYYHNYQRSIGPCLSPKTIPRTGDQSPSRNIEYEEDKITMEYGPHVSTIRGQPWYCLAMVQTHRTINRTTNDQKDQEDEYQIHSVLNVSFYSSCELCQTFDRDHPYFYTPYDPVNFELLVKIHPFRSIWK